MCQAMIDLKEEGRQEGRQEGFAEGRQAGLAEGRKENCIENAKALLGALDAETIARKLKLPLETVLSLKQKEKKYEPMKDLRRRRRKSFYNGENPDFGKKNESKSKR